MMRLKYGFTNRIHVRGLFAACAYLGFSLSAHAGLVGNLAPRVTSPMPNKHLVKYPDAPIGAPKDAANNRSYTLPPAANSGVFINDVIKPVIAGAAIDIAVRSLVPTSAFPLMAVAGAFAGGYVLGSEIYKYLDSNNITYADGQFYKREGAETLKTTIYRAAYNGEIKRGSLLAVDNEIYNRYNKAFLDAYNMYGYTTVVKEGCVVTTPGVYNCMYLAEPTNYKEYGPYRLTVQINEMSETWCVTSDGMLNPVPESGSCAGGISKPLPQPEVPPALGVPPANAPGFVKEVVDSGVPAPAGNPEVSGPPQAPGPTTTTVGPEGTTTTVVVNNYNYGGDTITVTQTTTETAPDGTTKETTTDDVPDKKTDCEKNPNMLMCQELDQVDPSEIPKETKNISFQAEDVLGGGQCPANVQASFSSIGGGAKTIIDWATFCNHALPLRALVIALASIMAMFIIMPGGRVE